MTNTAAPAADPAKLADALLKAVGRNDELQEVESWLNTGYLPLNRAISGDWAKGFPVGRVVELAGPSSSGKTWLATQAMISAQRAGGVAAFCDHERSFDAGLAQRLGLDTSPGRWVFKAPDTFEDSVAMFIRGVRAIRESGALPRSAPICWVFDSLASMVPKQKMEKDASDLNMNDTTALARLTSSVFPAVAAVCSKHHALALFLNQIRVKPGVVYGDPTTTPGGEAPKFYASVRVMLSASKIQDKSPGAAQADSAVLGQQVKAKMIKNKVGRPFTSAEWRFVFGPDGAGRFDMAGSLVDFAAERGILAKDGQRLVWTDGTKHFRPSLAKMVEDRKLLGELVRLVVASDAPAPEEPPEAPAAGDENALAV